VPAKNVFDDNKLKRFVASWNEGATIEDLKTRFGVSSGTVRNLLDEARARGMRVFDAVLGRGLHSRIPPEERGLHQ
jgi:transposase